MEKLRIVLVDDEPLVLSSISEMIESIGGPYEIVGTTFNGLKLIREKSPDIAVVDIKMPIMDGLEMAKAVREEGFSTRIVLLSAYKDFKYAQKGIDIGVYNYILKHEIDGNTIGRLFEKIRQEMDTKTRTEYYSQRNFLREMVNGNLIDSKIMEYFTNKIPKNLDMMVFRANHPLQISGNPMSKPVNSCFIENEINKKLEELEAFCMIPYQAESYLLFFENVTPSQIYRFNKLNECVRKITGGCRHGGTFSFVALSYPISLRDIAAAARCMFRHMDVESIQKGGSFSSIALHDADGYGESVNPDTSLYALLGQRNPLLINEFLDHICETVKNTRVSRNDAEKLLFNIVNELKNFRKANNMPPLSHTGLMAPEVYWIGDAVEWIKAAAKITLDEMESIPKANSKKLQSALDYIHRHYRDAEFTQQQVADKLDFSSVYLSILFRKELNMSFLEYVTKCRIDLARQLLLHSNKKVYEISQEVGYLTSQYFSRIFKQQTGVTPAEFREKGGAGNER